MRLFALAFVLGALGLQQSAELPSLPILPGALAALLSLSLIASHRRAVRCALLIVAGALGGYGLAAWRAEALLAHSLPRAWEGEDIEITGIVAALPQLTEDGKRFLFDVESVRTPRAVVPPTLALTWYAERAKGRDEAIAPPHLASGQRWRIVVRLKRPRGLANPHSCVALLPRFPGEEEGGTPPPEPSGVPLFPPPLRGGIGGA